MTLAQKSKYIRASQYLVNKEPFRKLGWNKRRDEPISEIQDEVRKILKNWVFMDLKMNIHKSYLAKLEVRLLGALGAEIQRLKEEK